MNTPELADTLLALISAFETPHNAGLLLTGAEVTAPLQLSLRRQGRSLLLSGAPPATVMTTGMQPVVHRARLTLAANNPAITGVGDYGR